MRTSLIIACLTVGCANDPVYVQCPTDGSQPACLPNLEAGQDDGTGTDTVVASAASRLLLPINTEKPEDATARMARAAELGIDVPYVKLGDIEVEVEWSIKNLTDMDGDAKIQLNGATEFFEYDPAQIVLDIERDAPPTPPLDGDIPLHIPAGATITGLFREDQVREASIDIEQVTRANVNPFKATLTINKNDAEIQPLTPYDPTMPDAVPMPTGPAIPREAFANMVRVDLVFLPSRHMVLEYTVRVRDVRGGMLNDLLTAAPANELQQFNIMPYAVMAAP